MSTGPAYSDFAKYQALGNDYLVIDPRQDSWPGGDTPPSAEVVRLLCDRHFGVGADGVLFGPLAAPEPGNPVPLRLFNSDGSECGMSGNGLRMFALHLAEHYAPAWRRGEEFVLRTRGGDADVRVLDFADGLVRLGMGRPQFGTGREVTADPVAVHVGDQRVQVTDVRLGVPHTVVLMDQISREVAHELGHRIAWHPRTPDGTNVEFVRVRDRQTLEVEVWERAAGYTLASGSSACAAAAVAYARGLVDTEVRVHMPGGALDVVTGQGGEVAVTGVTTEVMRGTFSPAFRTELDRLGALPERKRQ